VPCAALGRGCLSRFQFTGDGAGRLALGDAFLSEFGFTSNYRTGAAAPGLILNCCSLELMDDDLTGFGKIVEIVRPLLHHASTLWQV
jgi:hypothetical protein